MVVAVQIVGVKVQLLVVGVVGVRRVPSYSFVFVPVSVLSRRRSAGGQHCGLGRGLLNKVSSEIKLEPSIYNIVPSRSSSSVY